MKTRQEKRDVRRRDKYSIAGTEGKGNEGGKEGFKMRR